MAKQDKSHTPQPELEETAPEQCKVEAPSAGTMSRRNFLKLGISVLGIVAAVEATGASFMYFQSHAKQGAYGGVVTAGWVEDFEPGSVTEFPDARFFLVRAPDGGFLAVHSRCPHLGCTVIFVKETQEFLCPCHASEFDFYGDHGTPPAPSAMDVFSIEIRDSSVRVDTAVRIQRDAFSADQLTYYEEA